MHAGPHVRPATPDDLARVNEIYNHYVRTSHVTFDLEATTIEWRRAWLEEHTGGGHLLAPKAGHPTLATVDGQPGLLWRDPSSPRGQELVDVLAVLPAAHGSNATSAGLWEGGPANTPNSSVSFVPSSEVRFRSRSNERMSEDNWRSITLDEVVAYMIGFEAFWNRSPSSRAHGMSNIQISSARLSGSGIAPPRPRPTPASRSSSALPVLRSR